MIHVLRSEALRLTRRSYLLVATVPALFMIVSMVLAVANAAELPDNRGPVGIAPSRDQLATSDGLSLALGTSQLFIGVVSLAVAAVHIGADHGTGAIRNLLIREPRRLRLLASKWVAVYSYVALATIVAVVIGVAAATLLAPSNDITTDQWFTADGLAATTAGALNLTLSALGWATLGATLGTLTGSSAIAIAVGVAYAIPVELVLSSIGIIDDVLPAGVFRTVSTGGSADLGYPAALAIAACWCLVAAVGAAATFARRDIDH